MKVLSPNRAVSGVLISLTLGVLLVSASGPAIAATGATKPATPTAKPVHAYQKELDLASQAVSAGRVGEAHSIVDPVIERLASSGGEHALELADFYMVLGRMQILENLSGLADDSFSKALQLRESKLGDKHELVIQTCKEYADLLERLDRKDEATKLRERVTLAKVLGAPSDNTKAVAKPGATAFDKCLQAARVADNQANYDEARTQWKLVVQEAEKTGGKDGRLPFALVHLADHMDKRSNAEAIAVLKRAAKVREETGATNTVGMARNLQRLGILLLVNQDYQSAEPVLKQALDVEDSVSAGYEMTAQTLQSLASACLTSKNYAKADEYAKRLAELAAKAPQSPNSANHKRSASGIMMGVASAAGRFDEVTRMSKEMMSNMPQAPSSEQMKAIQDAYAEVDRDVDKAEEKAFKS